MKKLIFLASAIAAMISFSGCSNGASDNNKKLSAEEARVTEWKFPSLIGANQDTKLYW